MKHLILVFCCFVLFYACKPSQNATSGRGYTSGSKVTGKIYAPSTAGKKVSDVIQSAKKYLGTPYRYSGMDRQGMDCSGLICKAFQDVGVVLPHHSAEQSKLGEKVSLHDLKPGDLVFMGATKGSDKVNHVGMVISVGSNKIIFIHASTKKGVIEENLLEKWYEPLFIKGTRLF